MEEYPFSILEENEKKVLGFNLVMNPILEYDGYIKKHKLFKPTTITNEQVGREIRVVGILSSIRKIKTKKGTDMAFITIQDEYTKLSGVLFTTTFVEYFDMLERNGVYLFKVKVEQRNKELQLVIQKIHKL